MKVNSLNRLFSLLLRIAYIYILLWILRIIFLLYNGSQLGGFDSSEYCDLVLGSLVFDTSNVTYTFMFFIFMSVIPLSRSVVAKKWYRIVLFVLFLVGIGLIVLSNLSDTIYFKFAQKRMTSEEMHFVSQNANNLAVVWYSMLNNWYLILVAIALVVLSIKVYTRTSMDRVVSERSSLYYIIYSVLSVFSIALIVIGMRGGLSRDVRPITPTNAAGYTTTAIKTSVILSNPFCVFRTISDKQIPSPQFFQGGVPDSLCLPIYSPTVDSLFGTQSGKNLVIIVLESFSAEHSQFLYPQIHTPARTPVPYTPFLDSLMQQSYTFINAYSNGFKSIEALPAILNSIPSLGAPFSTNPTALSVDTGIGWTLKQRGYTTLFFNGSPRGSMGFDASAKLAGVDNAFSMDNYTKKHTDKEYDGIWGIWDEPFLKYMAQELTLTPQPFFSTIFTISSHHPFKVPKEYRNILPKGTTNIHQPIAYTDHSLKEFFKTAKQQQWYENTVFVLISDHISYKAYADLELTDPDSNNIIYIIHTPDESIKGINQTVTQQIDVAPTLYHLYGVEEKHFAFGRNIFDSLSVPFAINANGGLYKWRGQDTVVLLTIEEMERQSGVEVDRFKGFVQEYGQRLKDKNFTVE